MKAGEVFGLAIICVLFFFLFREVVKTFDDVEVEATPNGVKMRASRRGTLVADAVQPLVLQGN